MRFSTIIFLTLLLFCQYTKAQLTEGYNSSLSHKKQVTLNIGSQGAGAEFGYGIVPRAAARLGANFIPVTAYNVYRVTGFNSTSKASAKFNNIHLLGDFIPFKTHSGFRLVGGVAYFFKASGDLTIIPSEHYTYGDIELSEEQVGTVTASADWGGIAPYLGLGLANLFPTGHFNINFDLGTYYLGKPKARMVGTGILESNASQTGQFQTNINNYRFMPVLQLNFNYKL
uniref:hypothetical protein n=1 Tax=Mucilaginibacter sp. Bleaf8 TaxID=2834430 RepID=UPI0020BEE779|nr:hypothetical protein [Mucilaginibacter sp. Bleaf8]